MEMIERCIKDLKRAAAMVDAYLKKLPTELETT